MSFPATRPSLTRRALVCGALGAAAWPGPSEGRTGLAGDKPFAAAAAHYRAGAWPRAYGAFLALANQGHADAAAIVLFMHRLGPPLYGRYWDLSTDEQEDFEQLVSALPARDRAPTGPSAQARQRGLNEPLPCLARGGAGPERR